MTIPLMVLAALSALGGLLLLGGWITDWLTPVVGETVEHHLAVSPLVMSLIVVLVVAAGIAVAWLTIGRTAVPRTAPATVSVFTRAARADLYGDALNENLLMRPGDRFVGGLITFDDHGVDGAVNGTGLAFSGMSQRFRRTQTGYVRSYALSILGGAVLVLLALVAVNLG
jgi:NADH-quinone oxidoreductase subunit L